MMVLPLYYLDPEYAALAEVPLDSRGAQDEATSQLAEALAALQDEVAPKVLALAKVVRSLESEADVLEGHAKSLHAKAQSRRRRVDALRRWMKLEMDAASLDKTKDAFVTVWLQASPAAMEVVDERAIPPEFQRAVLRLPYWLVPAGLKGFLQHLDVDRAAILERAKQTGEVPNGITIRTGDKQLRIR